jgi:hypothetical protein
LNIINRALYDPSVGCEMPGKKVLSSEFDSLESNARRGAAVRTI